MRTERPSQLFLVLACSLIFFSFMSCSKDEGFENKQYEKGKVKEVEKGIQEGTSETVSGSQPEGVSSLTSGTKNSPPQIRSVKLMPEVFKPGDTLYVDVESSDADGDEVTIFYEWYKNGELISTERNLNAFIKRGDKLVIKIKPFDGKDYGKVVTLNREILNTPPVIVDHRDYQLNKDTFRYQVKASDPDGDALTYSLNTAPKGMEIDSETGMITWKVNPEDFTAAGRHTIVVRVSDGHGGLAEKVFYVTIGQQEQEI